MSRRWDSVHPTNLVTNSALRLDSKNFCQGQVVRLLEVFFRFPAITSKENHQKLSIEAELCKATMKISKICYENRTSTSNRELAKPSSLT